MFNRKSLILRSDASIFKIICFQLNLSRKSLILDSHSFQQNSFRKALILDSHTFKLRLVSFNWKSFILHSHTSGSELVRFQWKAVDSGQSYHRHRIGVFPLISQEKHWFRTVTSAAQACFISIRT